LKTKNCPFCSKEISDEAIICKYCHRLLIDENGNDILPEDEIPTAGAEEAAVDEDKTIVYKKEDLQKLLNKQESEDEVEEDVPAEDEEFFEEDEDDEADVQTIIDNDGEDEEDEYESDEESEETEEAEEEDEGFPEDDGFEGEEEDDGYEYENVRAPMPQRAPRRAARPRDDRYDDADLAAAADYDPKRTFIVTAIVTLGILLIIIVAILVGYKLFGFGKNEETAGEKTPVANTASTAAGDVNNSAAAGTKSAADDSAFVPSVVNDTLSENPEEIVNSAASDPVVDSAATAPEASAPDSSAAASSDSGVNIVIRPDPNADNSAAAGTDSSTDSQQPGDGPSSADNSAAEPAGPGAPGFDAAGSYYSWGEAETLMANYASSNGLGSNYSYYGGTDGVEMLYAFYDDFGNATVYRVDLQTGYVTAY
jgi:hypothetical protein